MFFLAPDDPTRRARGRDAGWACGSCRCGGRRWVCARAERRPAGVAARAWCASRPTSRRWSERLASPGRAAAPPARSSRPRSRRSSPRTAGSARTTAPRSLFDPWRPQLAPLSVVRAGARRRRGTTARGRGGSTSGWRSGRRSSPRSAFSASRADAAGAAAAHPRGIRRALRGLSQSRQRARARAGSSSPPISSPSGSPTTSRPRAAAGGRDARSVGRGGRERGRGRGREPHRRVRRGLLQPADLAQRRARRRSRSGSRTRSWPAARSRGRPASIAHLVRGFGDDGMWYEGENYHLFALRGQLLAMGWARQAGVDMLADPSAGRAARGGAAGAGADRAARLHLPRPQGLAVRRVAGAADVPRAVGGRRSRGWATAISICGTGFARSTPRPRRRPSASTPTSTRPAPSRRAVRARAPTSPGGPCSRWRRRCPRARATWRPGNTLLESQGLAILRRGDRYASLECGAYGGGHGHPDRLHLTLHANGRHWLPDPGTGSYVARDLFWYRSTLAHNAPRLDGASQPPRDAECAAFGESGDWAWARGRCGEFTRTVVAGPRYLLDVLELSAPEEHLVELPWHPNATVGLEPPGRWEPEQAGAGEFVSATRALRARRCGRRSRAPRQRRDGATLLAPSRPRCRAAPRGRRRGCPAAGDAGDVLRAARAGLRTAAGVCGRGVGSPPPVVRGWRASGDVIEVETASGIDRHVNTSDGWDVTAEGARSRSAVCAANGAEAPPGRSSTTPGRTPDDRHGARACWIRRRWTARSTASTSRRRWSWTTRTSTGGARSRTPAPRSSPPPRRCTGTSDALYVAWTSASPSCRFRSAAAPPLRLDNEPDDIHADGIQVYLRPGARPSGLRVPRRALGRGRQHPGAARRAAPPAMPAMVRGAWQPTEQRLLADPVADRPAGVEPRGRSDADRLRPPGQSHRGRAASGDRGSWCGAAAAAGSTSAATGRIPRRFGVLELR